MSKVSRISLCLIARDEAPDIARCLRSVRGVVSEMVVVDTGSSDDTARIAEAEGARVVHVHWADDFAAARNRSLDEATGDIALVLDADEELTGPSQTRAELEAAFDDQAAWGWQLRVRNLTPPGEIVAYTDVGITRLFRRAPGIRFESPIHEQVTPSILRAGKSVVHLDVTILHHGYAGKAAQGASRSTRNQRLLERLVLPTPEDAYAHYQLGATFQAAGEATRAQSALDRALALDRGSLPARVRANLLLRLAQLGLARREDPLAARFAAQSLALDPENAVALQVLAVAKVGAADIAGALGAFVKLRAHPGLRTDACADIDRTLAALRPR